MRARVGRCGCMLGGGGRRRAGPGRRAARTSFAQLALSLSASSDSHVRVSQKNSTMVDFTGLLAMLPYFWRAYARRVAGGLAHSPPPGRILRTQRIPRGRDPILSTQTFRAAGVFRLGAMSRKLAIFKGGNYVHWYNVFPSPLSRGGSSYGHQNLSAT